MTRNTRRSHLRHCTVYHQCITLLSAQRKSAGSSMHFITHFAHSFRHEPGHMTRTMGLQRTRTYARFANLCYCIISGNRTNCRESSPATDGWATPAASINAGRIDELFITILFTRLTNERDGVCLCPSTAGLCNEFELKSRRSEKSRQCAFRVVCAPLMDQSEQGLRRFGETPSDVD